MARRYSRREFLTDASFALGSSVLLKVLAPQKTNTEMPVVKAQSRPSMLSESEAKG